MEAEEASKPILMCIGAVFRNPRQEGMCFWAKDKKEKEGEAHLHSFSENDSTLLYLNARSHVQKVCLHPYESRRLAEEKFLAVASAADRHSIKIWNKI